MGTGKSAVSRRAFRAVVLVALAISVTFTVSTLVNAAPPSTVAVNAGVLEFTAGSGIDNNVSVTLAGATYTITDSESLSAGAGCTSGGANQVTCPSAGVTSVRVLALDGNDTVSAVTTTPANLQGGDGNDSLTSASGADTLNGGNDSDVLQGGAGNDSIDGSAGTDTVSYSSATAAVTIFLATITAQNTGGAGSDTLAGIENLTGSGFNDALTGSQGNNTITGGAGNDTIAGGLGADTASYSTAASAVTVSLATTGSQATGGAGSDTIGTVENLTGTNFNDTLTGSSGANTILGEGGNDTINPNTGADVVSGGPGTDTATYSNRTTALSLSIDGSANDGVSGELDNIQTDIENLTGGTGADTLQGSQNNNSLSGGGGTDTLSYANASAGVVVNLASLNTQNTGGAGIDLLSSLENVTGSNFADDLMGTTGANVLNGGLGNDVLTGGAGNDTVTGGTGIDTASYTNATAAVAVNLTTTTAQATGGAGSDRLSGNESVTGSNFNDTLTGSTSDNVLTGGPGNDTLNGAAGIDTVSYANANGSISVSLAVTTAQNTGGAGTDTLTANESLVGSIQNDVLTGSSSGNTIDGLAGNDTITGGSGNDTLTGGAGLDTVSGTAGADTLFIRDLETDQADCGADADVATADTADSLVGCETANLPSPAQITGGPAEGSTTGSSTPAFSFTAFAPAVFECRVDGGSFYGCASPYVAGPLGDGPHTFTVRAIDAAGDVDRAPVSRSFFIDTTPPDTLISGGPAEGSTVNDATPEFSFESEIGATFECSVAAAAFAACAAPFTLQTLADGSHEFRVRAVDAVGNADATPDVRQFFVDTTPPDTSIDGGPAEGSRTADSTPAFSFSSEPGASFECRTDAAAFASCSSPITNTALGDGAHQFDVRATDSVGNVESSPASRQFVVDTTPPDLIVTAPVFFDSFNVQPVIAIFGATDESVVTITCRVDGGQSSPCVSPLELPLLEEGNHTLHVDAADTVGNTSTAFIGFEIDTTPPESVVTNGPGAVTENPSPQFTFHSNEGSAHFECQIDGQPAAPCASPFTAPLLSDGDHVFTLSAIDPAGNVDPTPASLAFRVDTLAPTVAVSSPPTGSVVTTNTPQLVFSATDLADVTTTCQVDAGAAIPCTSPYSVPSMSDGTHTVTVHAADIVGNAASGATTFTVDTVPPDTTITGGPAHGSLIATTSPVFEFTSDPGATFECLVEGGEWQPCISGFSPTVAQGWQNFFVRAIDSNGVVDPSPAGINFNVDSVAPAVTITSPANGSTVSSSQVTATFTVSDATSYSTVCGYDGAMSESCNMVGASATLSNGEHTFTVESTDAAGNVASASVSFTVEIIAGVTTITVLSPSPAFNYFSVQASPGAQNTITMTTDESLVTFSDSTAPMVAGTGCTLAGTHSVTCPVGPLLTIALLGDGDDVFTFNTSAQYRSAVLGDAGDDTVNGGPGMELLQGSEGADTIHGGGGTEDGMIYQERTVGVTADFDEDADDGEPGEGDFVDLDSGQLTGGTGNDEFTGAAGADLFFGYGGDDVFHAGAGNDRIEAGDGDDLLDGGIGTDEFFGGNGNDTVDYSSRTAPLTINAGAMTFENGEAGENDASWEGIESARGGSGADTVFGSSEINTIDPGPGEDIVDGSYGADTLLVRDGETDQVACGSDGDVDSVTADFIDSIDCQAEDVIDRSIPPTVPSTVSVDLDTVEFIASPGSVNDLVVSQNAGFITIEDIGGAAISAGTSCSNLNQTSVACDATGVVDVILELRDGDDSVSASTVVHTRIEGGDGDDVLGSTGGATTIAGGRGDDVGRGSNGDDTIDGGAGADSLFGGSGSDLVIGGRGSDDVVVGDAILDQVRCGTGIDMVQADDEDQLQDCEQENRRLAPQFERKPDQTISENHATIEFSRPGAVAFVCSLDGEPPTACSSPLSLTDLAEGEHTFEVAATAIVGEAEALPTASSLVLFSVDTSGAPVSFVSSVAVTNGALQFKSGRGQANQVTVSEDNGNFVISHNDSFLKVGQGCSQQTEVEAICPSGGVSGIEVYGYDGNDSLTSQASVLTKLDGGEGDDSLAGGIGDDVLIGGDGSDTVDYSRSPSGVVVDLVETGPQFTVGSGTDTVGQLEGLKGSEFDDELAGDDGANSIIGGDGDDDIRALLGNDNVLAGRGNDVVSGDGGADWLYGESGDDQIDGGDDGDVVDLGDGVDSAEGGSGDDYLLSSDASPDLSGCGDGVDYSISDRLDTVTDCESGYMPVDTFVSSGSIDASGVASRASATFSLSSTVSPAIYECSVDDGEFFTCETPFSTGFLARGAHVFKARSLGDYEASVVEFEVAYGSEVSLDNGRLIVEAADEVDDIIEISTSGTSLVISNSEVSDGLGLVASQPCDEFSETSVTCPVADIESVSVLAGDGDDSVVIETAIPTVASGGSGDDDLTGSAVTTRLVGGAGADTFRSTGSGPTVDYSNRSESVSLSIDSSPNDGSSIEGDNILITQGKLVGGAGDDQLIGSGGNDVLEGASGHDVISGNAGSDEILAADGLADVVDCGESADLAAIDLQDANVVECESLNIETVTSIVSGPAELSVTSDDTPTFGFENIAATSFECRIDDDPPVACASPWTPAALEDGEHTFEVISYDGGEAMDEVAAHRAFAVDTTPPEARIISPSTGQLTGLTPELEFEVDSGAEVTCFVDGVPAQQCADSQPLATPLTDGMHTLRLGATDEHGNSTENADEVEFEVDSTSPETVVESSVDDGGFATSDGAVMHFQQDSNESLVFECALDAGEFEPCDSPWEPTLAEGARVLRTRAISEAGIPDPTPWQVSVTVDQSIPTLEFTAAPAAGEHVRSEDVSIGFSGTRHSGFECRVDTAPYEACESPFSPSISVEGGHTISVRALDESGPSPARPINAEFVVDNSPPGVINTWGVENEVLTEDPAFQLVASEPGSSFECALDQQYSWNNSTLGSCDFLSSDLFEWSDGSYRISIVAIDHAGNRSARAFHEFTVAKAGPPAADDIPPYVAITSPLPRVTSGVANYSTSQVAFEFMASESAIFSCAIDGAEYVPCESGVEYNGLGDGPHSFSLCSEDSSGNAGCWVDLVSFIVDTAAPPTPVLSESPSDGAPGDLATFRFESGEGSIIIQLDSGEWMPLQLSYSFQGLAAGAHELKYKAADAAGNESPEAVFNWNATEPQSGPYYEMQLVSPSAGSSYLVWPGPGDAGAEEGVTRYRVRTCEHPRGEACTEPGISTISWTDWEEYESGEKHSDGIHHSELTPTQNISSDAASVVSYEVQTIYSDGVSDLVRRFDAGPWPLDLEQSVALRNEQGGELDPDYISEDQHVGAAVEVGPGTGGGGVRRVGVFCNDQIDSFHNGLPSRRRPCASYSTDSGLEDEISQIQGYYDDGAEIAPRVLEVHDLNCGLSNDQFGESVLTCPQKWDGELAIPAGGLLESSDRSPMLKFFVELTNGQVQILNELNFEMPIIDSTPPDQPTDLEVGVDPDDAEGDGLIYADWSGIGDPVGTNEEAEGSGISKFAIQYRINGGEWSAEILQSAENEWSYLVDKNGLSVGDEVELRVTSIDRVGHRSSPTAGSAVAEADDPVDDDSTAPEAAMDNGAAIAAAEDGEPRMNIFANWNPMGEARYSLITLQSALFPSNVDTANPGDPFIETSPRSCANANSCFTESTSAYRIGMYRVRTTVTIGSSGTPAATYWSPPVSLEPLDGSFNLPAIPGNGAVVDTDGISIDETDSLADENAEEESEDNGAIISRKKPKMPKRYKSCFPSAVKGIRNLAKKPGKSDFNPADDDPWQHVCRLAYKLVKSDAVGTKRNDFVADKTRDAYALSGSRQYPTSLKGSYPRTITLLDEHGNVATKGIHAWPMLDSLGNTRAWVASRRRGKVRYWQLYHVGNPTTPFVADSMTQLKAKSRAAKLQGRACYRPVKGRKLHGPAASKRLKLTNSTVSLFKLDLGTEADRVRFFVPNRAFNPSSKSLHKTKVGCQTVSSKAAQRYDIAESQHVEIPETQTTFEAPDSLTRTLIQKRFVFKEGKTGGAPGDGKTYTTYNVKKKYGTAYVFVNTNSVHHGGVVRGLFPLDAMGMRLIGFTGYCDVNAFTRKLTVPEMVNGVELSEADRNARKTLELLAQPGMQWAYGQLTTNGARTGLYGWLPFASLGFTDPPGAPGPSDCNYAFK